jgi:hypothetical protein
MFGQLDQQLLWVAAAEVEAGSLEHETLQAND